MTIGGIYLVPPLSPVRKRALFESLRPLVDRPDPPTAHSESLDCERFGFRRTPERDRSPNGKGALVTFRPDL